MRRGALVRVSCAGLWGVCGWLDRVAISMWMRVAEVVWNRLPELVRVLYVKCVFVCVHVSPSSSGLV